MKQAVAAESDSTERWIAKAAVLRRGLVRRPDKFEPLVSRIAQTAIPRTRCERSK